MKGVARFLVK